MCRVDNFKGCVIFRLNFKLKGYVWRQYLRTFRWGNGYTTTTLLEIFTQRNFVADFIRMKFNFIKKTKTLIFEPAFGDLGVTHTCHLFYSSLESPWLTSYSSLLNFFGISYG